MSEKSPAYLWYPKDVLTSGKVCELTAEEECWYRRALDHAWLDEGLPGDPGKCALRIGKGCTAEAAKMILEMFFEPDEKRSNKMVNIKQEELRRQLRIKSKKRAEAGRLSGVSRRKHRDLAPEHVFNKSPNKTEAKTNIPIAYASSTSTDVEEQVGTPPALSIVPFKDDQIFDAISIYQKAFPNIDVTPAMVGHIMTDLNESDPLHQEAWRHTVNRYAANEDPQTNSYNPRKIGNMMSVFRGELKILKNPNGAVPNGKTNSRSERDRKAIEEHNAIESVRDRVNSRRRS